MRKLLIFVALVVIIIGAVAIYRNSSEEVSDDISNQSEDLQEDRQVVEDQSEIEIISKVEAYARETQQFEEDTELTFTISEEVWSNACLGLEREGQFCAQVITEGYQVIIETSDAVYTYRTDANADVVLLDNIEG